MGDEWRMRVGARAADDENEDGGPNRPSGYDERVHDRSIARRVRKSLICARSGLTLQRVARVEGREPPPAALPPVPPHPPPLHYLRRRRRPSSPFRPSAPRHRPFHRRHRRDRRRRRCPRRVADLPKRESAARSLTLYERREPAAVLRGAFNTGGHQLAQHAASAAIHVPNTTAREILGRLNLDFSFASSPLVRTPSKPQRFAVVRRPRDFASLEHGRAGPALQAR